MPSRLRLLRSSVVFLTTTGEPPVWDVSVVRPVLVLEPIMATKTSAFPRRVVPLPQLADARRASPSPSEFTASVSPKPQRVASRTPRSIRRSLGSSSAILRRRTSRSAARPLASSKASRSRSGPRGSCPIRATRGRRLKRSTPSPSIRARATPRGATPPSPIRGRPIRPRARTARYYREPRPPRLRAQPSCRLHPEPQRLGRLHPQPGRHGADLARRNDLPARRRLA